MPFENKQKFALWVHPETMEKVRKTYKEADCRSQSEFIKKAINFYWGYLTEESNTNYLAPMIQSTFNATLNGMEDRLARLLFKLAVEMSMTMHIMAWQFDVTDENIQGLKGYCVEEVKRLNGKISFDKAWQHQKGSG